MRRAFKYRVYPTRVQITKLELWLNLCRELYNAAIQERRDHWNGARISVNLYDQSKQLPAIKKDRTEFAEIYAQVLQQTLHRVDLAFQHFFRRVKNGEKSGYPRFKGTNRYESLTWPQDIGFRLVGTKKLKLSGIGEIRIKLHRCVEGKPKTCTLKREMGRWFAILSCDAVPAHIYPEATAEVGIDMGLESFAVLSTGEKVQNPRWYRKIETKLKDVQRKLSKKKLNSKRYIKMKTSLVKLHLKAVNQRNDFQHKLAHRIVSENNIIAVENLTVNEITKKSSTGLAKSIQDAAWSRFLSILDVKAEEAARRFVRVPPRGTSSTCSRCGAVKQKMLLERLHNCPCGLVLDRDVNASLNILRLGRSLQISSEKPVRESSLA